MSLKTVSLEELTEENKCDPAAAASNKGSALRVAMLVSYCGAGFHGAAPGSDEDELRRPTVGGAALCAALAALAGAGALPFPFPTARGRHASSTFTFTVTKLEVIPSYTPTTKLSAPKNPAFGA